MIYYIILFVLLASLVVLSLYLALRLRKTIEDKDFSDDELAEAEREITRLNRSAEDTEHNNQTIHRLHAESSENVQLIHMLQRVLIESLESDLKEANDFLDVALEKLSRVRPWQGDDILMTFISNARARIQGDKPLVHSNDPVQGLQREAPGPSEDSVQPDGEGGLQAAHAVSNHLQVAGQAESEPGRRDSN